MAPKKRPPSMEEIKRMFPDLFESMVRDLNITRLGCDLQDGSLPPQTNAASPLDKLHEAESVEEVEAFQRHWARAMFFVNKGEHKTQTEPNQKNLDSHPHL